MNGTLIGEDQSELERRAIALARLMPELSGQGSDQILAQAQGWGWWIGSPDQIIQQARAEIQAGIDHIVFQVYNYTDLKAMEQLGRKVIPVMRDGTKKT